MHDAQTLLKGHRPHQGSNQHLAAGLQTRLVCGLNDSIVDQLDAFQRNATAHGVVIFGDVSLHIVGERIHTGGSRHKGGQVHGQQGIGKYNSCQQLGRKEDPFTFGFILGNDGASPNLTACAGGGGNGDKMRNLLGDILVAAQEVIVVKQIPHMVDPQGNRPGNVHGHAAAYANDTVAGTGLIDIAAFKPVGFDGVFVHVTEDFHRNALLAEILFDFTKKGQLCHQAVGDQKRAAKLVLGQVGRQFVNHPRAEADGGGEVVGVSVVEVGHVREG